MAGRVGLGASKEAKARRIAVIRALWFADCSVADIGERLGISGKTVWLLAKRAGLPPRHESAAAPTPEQLAKAVVAKRPIPVGQPAKVELVVNLVVSRAAAERLTARAIREGRKLEALMGEILEGASK